MFRSKDCIGIALFAGLLAMTVGAQAEVIIDTVTVGNPGNAPDTRYETPGYGGVAYTYNIAAFEVTAGQYTEFLNAVAATDTYGLYNGSMWGGGFGCRIRQIGSPGRYTYLVDADGDDVEDADLVNRPVNYVSWGDAARFSNWLHNGQPTGTLTGNPVQDAGLTEDGSYFLDGAMSRAELLAVTREAGATWVIPSEDEWYKAAYHKDDGATGNYWDYPTQSNTAPTAESPPGTDLTNGSANYNNAIGIPYFRNEVGAYVNSESPYDTFDMGGNVWEWNEAAIGSYRGLRGGSYGFIEDYLRAAYRSGSLYPTSEYPGVGFRVAEVPEPATIALLAFGGMAVLGRRKR